MSAPRLVADNATYSAFAESSPRLAHTELAAPCRSPWDSTNSTAGPGVILSTASVITNKSQVSNLTVVYSDFASGQNLKNSAKKIRKGNVTAKSADANQISIS